MKDGTFEALDEACERLAPELTAKLTKDIGVIVGEAIDAAFEEPDEAGFYKEIVRPYVTANVYHRVATELTLRAEQHKALVDAADVRRYGTG